MLKYSRYYSIKFVLFKITELHSCLFHHFVIARVNYSIKIFSKWLIPYSQVPFCNYIQTRKIYCMTQMVCSWRVPYKGYKVLSNTNSNISSLIICAMNQVIVLPRSEICLICTFIHPFVSPKLSSVSD